MAALNCFTNSSGILVSQAGKMHGMVGDSLVANGLACLLTDHYKWISTITAQGGNSTSDQSDEAFRFSPATGDIYIMWLGTNDKILSGSNTNKQSVAKSAHLALLLHLSTQEGSNKVRAQSMSATGTWTNMTTSTDASGRTSSTNGSTLTASVTGTDVALVGYWNGAQTGTFSVTIDGVSKGTFNATPTGGTVPSNLGNNYGPFALTFSGLSNTSHSVVITVTSATGASNVVYIDFVAGYTSSLDASSPKVYVANTHDFTSAGNTAQGTTTAENTTFKTNIASNVTTAQGLGRNVSLIDADAVVGGSATLLGSDGVHPTQAGYIAVRDAFVTAIG